MTVYFLFLESIGTPELILIAFVALIVFGPRKLPGLGRQIGKYTTEFKRASNEFRRSWEYEVEMAEREDASRERIDKQENLSFDKSPEGAANKVDGFPAVENTIGRNGARRATQHEDSFAAVNAKDQIAAPEVYQTDRIDSAVTAETRGDAIKEDSQVAAAPSKREWL